MSEENKQTVVRGTVMYQALNKPNDLSGKYQIDLCQLDKKAVKTLEGLGLEVHDGDKKGKEKHGRYITPKANRQVTMVDADKNSWDVEQLLGNGTLVNACVRAYEYNHMGKSGVAVGLQAVQVLEHVSYDPAGAFVKEPEFVKEPSEDDVPF